MSEDRKELAKLTPEMWQRTDNGEKATPPCPHCGRHLGIRFGVWRVNGLDAWLCDKCGEWEAIYRECSSAPPSDFQPIADVVGRIVARASDDE
jgi:hypothetical protein